MSSAFCLRIDRVDNFLSTPETLRQTTRPTNIDESVRQSESVGLKSGETRGDMSMRMASSGMRRRDSNEPQHKERQRNLFIVGGGQVYIPLRDKNVNRPQSNEYLGE
ncbi:hypothetical protein AB6A40_007782 [Gnathostoma spinigerum]|uniref:Uncharacterized protein n=1 Tax=Gnathostoma spinigerum TaxID=75299 RepID=A0ABD6EVK2_9BILA